MTRLIEFLSPASAGTMLWPLLVECVTKGTALLALAALAALLFHRASAARRHLVWTLALGALALLPALLAAVPAWKVQSRVVAWMAPAAPAPASIESSDPIIAAEAARESGEAAAESGEPARGAREGPTASIGEGRIAPAARAATPARPIDWRSLAVAVWLAGAIVVLATFLTGHLVLRALLRDVRRIRDGAWHDLALEAADLLRLHEPFALLQGRGVPVPVAFGLLRPRVLLPPEADEWPVERRRSVLLHELAHVQRRDCLTQAVAQLACAIFWFHPAVWWASACLRVERERACDDRVLAARTRASDYADHLLDVVRSLRATRLAALGAVAFAKRSSLEGRLIAVLDPQRDRRAVSARVALPAALLAGIVLLPLAALEPQRAHAVEIHGDLTVGTSPRALTMRQQLPSTVLKRDASDASLEDQVAWARNEARKAGAEVWWIGWQVPAARRETGGFLSDTQGIDLAMLGHHGMLTLDDVLTGRQNGPTLELEKARRPTAILLRIEKGEIDRVRLQSLDMPADLARQAFYWFENVPVEQAYDWLKREAARSRDERVRARLVESIGYLDRPDLTGEYLRAALTSDDSKEVRKHAAFALGRDASKESFQLLRDRARTDRSSEVRRASVEALGQQKTPEALDALIDLAGATSDGDVRRAAFDVMSLKVMGEDVSKPGKSIKAGKELKTGKLTKFVSDESADDSADEASVPMDRGDFEVQRQAIESMGRYPEEQSLPRLRKIAETSPNAELRGQAVESIAKLGTPAAMAVVDQVIWKNTMEHPRIRAVEMLPRVLPAGEALDRLEKIASDHPARDTRRMAIETIGRLKGDRARDALLHAIDGKDDPDVQRQAVESYARLEGAGVDRKLESIARTHASMDVRRQAVESIGRRGGAETVDRLLAIAKDESVPDDVRRQAVESIGRRRDARVRTMLLDLAQHGDSPDVERQAVESLGRIEEDTMGDLAEIASSHPSGDVRRQAVETMSRRDPDRALPYLEKILKQSSRKTGI